MWSEMDEAFSRLIHVNHDLLHDGDGFMGPTAKACHGFLVSGFLISLRSHDIHDDNDQDNDHDLFDRIMIKVKSYPSWSS